MSRRFTDISKPLPTGRTLAGTVLRWIFILAVVLVMISGIGARLSHAATLVQMPPHCYDGCKPKGSVSIVEIDPTRLIAALARARPQMIALAP